MAKVTSWPWILPTIQKKNVLLTQKIHIAFPFSRSQLAKPTLLSATPIPPPAQNKMFEKAARFLSQLFHKFGSQSVCPDKIRPKVDGYTLGRRREISVPDVGRMIRPKKKIRPTSVPRPGFENPGTDVCIWTDTAQMV